MNNVERGRWKLVIIGRAFEQAEHGGSDSDEATAACANDIQPRGGGSVDASPFAMHDMLAGILRLYREKGSGADVQRQRLPADARRTQSVEESRGEMKCGRRCGYRPILAREYGLIIRPVTRIRRPFPGDIGG
jgi:hypothetical protein